MRPLAVILIAIMALTPGCVSTPDGSAPTPIFTPAEIEILVGGAQEAVAIYLAARVEDPSPAAMAALVLLRTAMELAIEKVRAAGAGAEAAKLEAAVIAATAPVEVVELEPLE